ncbi:MAG: efflux transporter periplasmic adaptor subunit [Candidatus Acidoferrum typicum]|jgi:RND family efflux transporter MFP subunit|nr:efflux transporter periplasmic adaptor subunit [Candidatus Acidoferrum typicum]
MTMQPQIEKQFQADGSQQPPASKVRSLPPRGWFVAIVLVAVFGGVLANGILGRLRAGATLRTETDNLAIPVVTVVTPQRSAPSQEIVLPGNVQPFITSPIFSRTNGYLKAWHFDIGARVKKGQLLAEIETPEVDQQLQQSRSNLATAEANLRLAEITKNRYVELLQTNAVSQQDVDNAVGGFNANKSIVEANQANVKQLETLQSFEKIYAPFDGVITARNTDIGDLINSGSNGNVKTDLFHIAQPGVLRVYVNVPEEYSRVATPGLSATLTLAEFPGKQFPGKLVRTADAINFATRTLLTEVDVNNPTGQVLSGSYAEVHFEVPGQVSTLIIPVDTLLFRSEGLRVAVVSSGKAELVLVTPGHDFGETIEIVSGLKGNESLIVSPPDSIVSGQQVQIAQQTAAGGTP